MRQRKIREYFAKANYTDRLRSLPIRRKNRLRRCREENDERKRIEKKKAIDDLPENVIHRIMNLLHPFALIDFLLTYQRATSIHGVYTLWLRKTRELNEYRKNITLCFRRLREEEYYSDGMMRRDYRRMKEAICEDDRRRIDRLLKFKHDIITARYNDLIYRRSLRLKEKKLTGIHNSGTRYLST